jgi:hypothetical protein
VIPEREERILNAFNIMIVQIQQRKAQNAPVYLSEPDVFPQGFFKEYYLVYVLYGGLGFIGTHEMREHHYVFPV